MSNIATTIVQSKHLLELGLDSKTTDMFWCFNPIIGWQLVAKSKELLKSDGDIEAWSFDKLFDIMAKAVKNYTLLLDYDDMVNEWRVWYARFLNGHITKFFHICTNESKITAAYEMVCWLLEQKILTFNNNEKD